jgi:tRNA 2-thiouridine synthesizing protein A
MQDLDITSEVCPMTFVRAKLRIEKMAVGETLKITMRPGEPAVNVPRALKDHGHEIVYQETTSKGLVELVVRKSSPRR